jgi:hypothetical protein
MIVTAVDKNFNLFRVENFMPAPLVEKILQTDWRSLEHDQENFQSKWRRRRIKSSAISWFWEWQTLLETSWKQMIKHMGTCSWPYRTYPSSTFWLDEPGFVCPTHTDGELPGAVQIYWIGDPDQGTTFYHNKDSKSTRHQFEFLPNSGYAMVNLSDSQGYRQLQWHGMLNTVKSDTYRVSSYIIATPEGGL